MILQNTRKHGVGNGLTELRKRADIQETRYWNLVKKSNAEIAIQKAIDKGLVETINNVGAKLAEAENRAMCFKDSMQQKDKEIAALQAENEKFNDISDLLDQWENSEIDDLHFLGGLHKVLETTKLRSTAAKEEK
jgi:hypothetical protein